MRRDCFVYWHRDKSQWGNRHPKCDWILLLQRNWVSCSKKEIVEIIFLSTSYQISSKGKFRYFSVSVVVVVVLKNENIALKIEVLFVKPNLQPPWFSWILHPVLPRLLIILMFTKANIMYGSNISMFMIFRCLL